MPQHVVFFVHGMGNFEPKWSESSIQPLFRRLVDTYPKLKAANINSGIDLVEINYNDAFEKWRDLWRTDAAAASATATASGLTSGVASELLAAAKAPTGNSFLQTHVLDTILFRYFTQARQEVIASVNKQILSRLFSDGQGNAPRWSIVAHSLGTAVTAHALQAMFTDTTGGSALGDAFKPQQIVMVANCSRLLWGKGDVYTSKVRPETHDGQGLCWRYINVRHKLDPVVLPEPFHPPPASWKQASDLAESPYLDIVLGASDLQSEDVHALEHYLGHPRVHVPIITSIIGRPQWVSEKKLLEEEAKWNETSLKSEALKKAKEKLASLATNAAVSLPDFLEKWVAYRRDVRKLGADGEAA